MKQVTLEEFKEIIKNMTLKELWDIKTKKYYLPSSQEACDMMFKSVGGKTNWLLINNYLSDYKLIDETTGTTK